MTPHEPSLADVLGELQAMRREMRAELAEMRASRAEIRADLAEIRANAAERQNTLMDAIADLRAAYDGHHHPHIHGDDGREIAA